jgi:hypothetical protein
VLTYQIRPRIFRHEPGQELTFPAPCDLCFHFQPTQPFGAEPGGGCTAVRAGAASVLFNANTGQHWIESTKPLSALHVTLDESTRTIRLLGPTLTISGRFESLQAIEEVITAVFFVLPTLLNIPFADPPYIESVDGKVGSSNFRWELAEWRAEFRTTTQQQQEERFARSWERMGLLAEPRRRRLAAGLHYFHVACRLARTGSTAGEFVAEVVLNLAKSLEVLFPPTVAGGTRDAARTGLRTLGFSDGQIESDFIPAMALRNEIDVGHVELGLFTMDQLKTIHAFTERAEGAFREMFERLLNWVGSGKVEIAVHELGPPRDKAIKVIDRLKSSTAGGAS